MQVRVEAVDLIDSSMTVDCSTDELGGFETAPYQTPRRATTNESSRVVQQVQGKKSLSSEELDRLGLRSE